ncbi:MAG TPA: secretin N-terminal domain-containing protein [Longimicrobiaceae bacterium]|jgi:Flp pilus assembly secretin CpaC|nr:secretin N-terminal domain-containing protein [Longimicrobiaceae bacterium]
MRTHGGLLLIAVAVAACATAAPRGELLTVGELRARQAHGAASDSLAAAPAPERATASPAPRPRPAGSASAPGGPASAAKVDSSASIPPRSGPAAPAARSAAPRVATRPAAHRFPAPRWIHVDDPNPPVIPFQLFEDPIADVMRSLSEAVGVNIVLDQDTVVRAMKLTAEVHDLPWPLGLEAVLEAHRLRPVQLASGVIKIVSEKSARDDQQVEEVSLRFLTARDIQSALDGILRSGSDSSSARVEYVGAPETTRRLIVYGSPEKLSQVRSLVGRLDRRPPTISVETRIVSVDRSRMRRVGLTYAFGRLATDSAGNSQPVMDVRSAASGGVQSSYGPAAHLVSNLGGLGRVDLNVFIDAVVGSGFAETQTTPSITTTSEMSAQVRIGDAIVLPNNQPIFAGGGYVLPGGTGQSPQGGAQQQGGGSRGQAPAGYGDQGGGLQPGAVGAQGDYGQQVGGYTRFQTGTALKVTPYALGDGLIRVRVDLQRDGGQLSTDGRSITGGNQTAYTDVIVRDGSPIVIAGLTVHARSRGRNGVPVLSDLPLLGSLFRMDENAEHYQDLIIVLTPRIETDELAN